MEEMEVVEELTDQVEVIYHEDPEEFDPLSIGDEEMMELEEAAKISLSLAQRAEDQAATAAAQPEASTSRKAFKSQSHKIDHVFRVPVGPAPRTRRSARLLSRLEPFEIRTTHTTIPLSVDGFSIEEYEARLAAEKVAQEEEEERQKIAAEEAEWEDTFIYVDLDDIPSVQELFAVHPDEFLSCQSKVMREQPKKPKPLHPTIQLKFYNLDAKNPILQIGRRFYMGKYEEAIGSGLFFREKNGPEPEPIPSTSTCPQPRRPGLKKLTTDLVPPPDPLFGSYLKPKTDTKEYELVANVRKVLKMTRRNVIPLLDPEESESESTDEEEEEDVQILETETESPETEEIPKSTLSLSQGGTYEEALAYVFAPKFPSEKPRDEEADTSESDFGSDLDDEEMDEEEVDGDEEGEDDEEDDEVVEAKADNQQESNIN